MSIFTAILIFSLYEVSKKLFDKGFDAAWEPVGDSLKSRFKKWAGTDEESKRQAAFAALAEVARERTISNANNPEQAELILFTLNEQANEPLAKALAQEAAKLILLSDQPDINQMVLVTQKHLRMLSALQNKDLPSGEIIAAVFTDFLVTLRNLLLDEQLNLGQKEVLRELRNIVSYLQPDVDDLETLEADYLLKIVEKNQFLTMQGISPKVQNRTIGIRMEDVFIPLQAVADDSLREMPKVLHEIKTWLVKFGGILEENLANTSTPIIFDKIYEEGGIDSLYAYVGERYYSYVDLIMEVESLDIQDYLEDWQTDIVVNMYTITTYPHVVVQGDPGSGKSTLTRYLAWALANHQLEDSRFPIRIRAIEFGDELASGRVNSLESYLLNEAGRFSSLFEHKLLNGRGLLLVDGLDEVREIKLRVRVKEEVEDFIADPVFTDNLIFITTRIVGYERTGLTGQFPHFTLKELQEEQITTFVENWYQAIHDEIPETLDVAREKKQLLEAIMKNESILRMARNPLLLTIIALIKWQGRTLPEQRVLLYDVAAQTLIRSWPLTQRYIELDELFIREWLAPVALHVFRDKTTDLIDEYTLQDLLVESMQKLRSMTKSEARSKSQALLEDVSFHSGILLPRGTDSDGRNLYGFLHQTFAEYLTAFYLAGLWEDGDLNLVEHAHVPYWREVLLLMAGHLGIQRRAKAGQIIKGILELQSSPYEDIIHQDLLLACRVLADGVPAGPSNLIEDIIRQLLKVWETSKIYFLQQDIEELVADFRGSEYEDVLSWLAIKSGLSARRIYNLITRLSFSSTKPLIDLSLQAEDADVRYEAARWLANRDDAHLLDTMVGLLQDEDAAVRYEAARWLANRDDARGLDTMVGLLQAEDARVRNEAASWLANRDDAQLLDTMVGLLQDEDARVRYQAASWLINNYPQNILSNGTLIRKMLNDTGSPRLFLSSSEPHSVADLVYKALTTEHGSQIN